MSTESTEQKAFPKGKASTTEEIEAATGLVTAIYERAKRLTNDTDEAIRSIVPQQERQPKTIQTEWDLTPLASGDDDPKLTAEAEIIDQATERFVNKWKYLAEDLDKPIEDRTLRTDYLENSHILKEALDDFEEYHRVYGIAGDSYYYVVLRRVQDQRDPVLKALHTKLTDQFKARQEKMRFFTHNIANKIQKERESVFLQDPILEPYRHFFERLRASADYLLPEGEEKVLSKTSSTAFDLWIKMMEDLLSRQERQVEDKNGKLITKQYSELSALIVNPIKRVRDSAAAGYNDILESLSDVAEYSLNAILQHWKDIDELREKDEVKVNEKPESSRLRLDDIEPEVVEAMIQAVLQRTDIPHLYYALKAQLLGVPQLQYHERGVEYSSVRRTHTYEEAVGIIADSFGNIDPEFRQLFEMFVTNGQIDAFPRKGKRSGATTFHDRLNSPIFINMNFTGILSQVLTNAHESGHGINYEKIKQTQNQLNYSTSKATSEVASNFFEEVVNTELVRDIDPGEERLALLMSRIGGDIGSIFRQASIYKFEQQLHQTYRQKGYISKQEIGALFMQTMSAYMGNAVVQSEGSQNWWIAIPHIFRTPFYVYSYASGLLIAKALHNMVREDFSKVATIKEFLSAGTSASPKEIFAKAGIDITDPQFWQRGLDEVADELKKAQGLAIFKELRAIVDHPEIAVSLGAGGIIVQFEKGPISAMSLKFNRKGEDELLEEACFALGFTPEQIQDGIIVIREQMRTAPDELTKSTRIVLSLTQNGISAVDLREKKRTTIKPEEIQMLNIYSYLIQIPKRILDIFGSFEEFRQSLLPGFPDFDKIGYQKQFSENPIFLFGEPLNSYLYHYTQNLAGMKDNAEAFREYIEKSGIQQLSAQTRLQQNAN